MFGKIVLCFLFIFYFSGFILAQKKGSGKGIDQGSAVKCSESDKFIDKNNQAFWIVAKRSASYTDVARMNRVQGTVKLRVKFLKTGKIGKIKVLDGLPDGLTLQAIFAAKKICFRPEIINGEPRDVVKEISYSFTIY
jgi:TonB family protein